jgi:hypothetical protein
MRWLLWSILAVLVWPVLVKADSQQQTYNNFQALPRKAKEFLDIGQATIDNPTAAGELIRALLSDEFVHGAKDKQAYCIIHVLRWGEPDSTTKKQAIQAQNWYLYSTLSSTKAGWTQEDFTKNKRLLGSHKVYILYIHLNVTASTTYIPSYRLTVTKKVPANLQHLLTLFQTFAPGTTGANPNLVHVEEITTDYYGWGALDLQYDPSDITVSSTARAGAADSSPETKLSDDITFDNEGGYNFDFGFAVPIKKISQVNVNFSNGTAIPVNVNDLSVFMVVDGYLKPVDVKSSKWTNWPHPLAGAAFAKRPLSRILLGGAWGPRFAELYLGAMFVKQPKRTAGDSCKGSNTSGVVTGSYQYCAQFSIGINLPVSGIASALSKPK